jgi:hypothetical protein
MAQAYAQAHAEDMKVDGNDDIDPGLQVGRFTLQYSAINV